jgi:transposase
MGQQQITIPLDIADVNVLSVEFKSGAYHIKLESSLEYAYCRQCGQRITTLHEREDWVKVQHLPILDRAVFLYYRPKRYRCPDCEGGPTTTQRLSWHVPNSPHTVAYDRYLLRMLVNSTLEDVTHKAPVSYDSMVGVLERCVATAVDWDRYSDLNVLGLDEIALKKGQRDYVVIVSTRQKDGNLAVLGVLGDRTEATVQAFLDSIPARLRDTITTTCCDLYDSYLQACRASLPQARLVIDRFHVARLYRDAADSLRKSEMKRLKRTLPAETYRTLKGVLWAFRKRRDDLLPDERAVVDRLFALSPSLEAAYALREDLTLIFDTAPAKNKAKRLLRDWQAKVSASGLDCFDTFLDTLNRFWNEITNYFIDFQSSGFIEGLNNKLKVLKRRCYGLFNLTHLFQRIFLDLEGYRLFT